jgi:hypothetical protein
MGITMKQEQLDVYVDKLERGELFSLSRWGNGEFTCMNHPDPKAKNKSGHHYFPELSEELRAALLEASEQSGHYLGLQNLCYRKQDVFITDEVRKLNIQWAFGDVFHRASIKGVLFPLIEQLRKMPLVFVGPRRMKVFRKKLFPNIEHHIVVPLRDCWRDKKRIVDELEACDIEGVYCFSASLLTDLLITHLHPMKKSSWLINFGSLWDVYLGRNTRRYHNQMSEETKRANLGIGNGEEVR